MPKTDYKHFAILFSFFLVFPVVQSKKGCSTSFCGNKTLPIKYPFQFQGQNQKECNFLPLNLQCINQSVPLLNLPNIGDFYVRNINYSTQIIQLHDPNNCLPTTFMSGNFSYSPLNAVNYMNYTFFSCSKDSVTLSFTPISCLSNSTISVLATASISRAQDIRSLGCNMTYTLPIPVSSPFQYEYNGFNEDLLLTWNVPTCQACVKKQGHGAGYIVLVILLGIVLPNLSVIALYGLCLGMIYFIALISRTLRSLASGARRIWRRIRAAREISLPTVTARPSNNATAPPSNNVTARPSNIVAAGSNTGSAINKFRTILVGESKRIPGPNSTTCPVCLGDYNPGETVKCLTDCEHCFHQSCIEQWLRTHNTCPICRNAAL